MKNNIFINKYVMACAISIVIALVGFICMNSLPVEQYPNIAPPQVMVMTSYTGADANKPPCKRERGGDRYSVDARSCVGHTDRPYTDRFLDISERALSSAIAEKRIASYNRRRAN